MKLKTKFIFPALVTAVILTSCGGNSEENQKGTVEVEETNFESEEDDYVLPQPITMAQMFKEAGLTYVSGKTNNSDNKGKYSQKIDQLLNLGVYSTDLAYCAINGKTQEARKYLIAIQYLGSKVGLESVFSDKELVNRFDKNLGNQEQMEALIYDIQDKIDSYLDDNSMRFLAAVEFAGAWTEGVYLGIDDARKNPAEIGTTVVEQMTLLENTVKGLKSHPAKDDKRLNEIITSFEKVLSTYNGLESVKKANANKNFVAPQLSSIEFENLASQILKLRSSIVSTVK